MSTPNNEAQAVMDWLNEALTYARATEAVVASLRSLPPVIQGLGYVLEIDPALKPELRAALDAVAELGDALESAAQFLTARFDVASQRLQERL